MDCPLSQPADMSTLLLAMRMKCGRGSIAQVLVAQLFTRFMSSQDISFVQSVTAYVVMSNDEFGLNTFTERDDGNRFITLMEDATGKETKLELRSDQIAYQRAIVCRDMSSFCAKISGYEDLHYVAKFFWASDKRQPEANLLTLIRGRGVKRVAKLFGHYYITSIANMREGWKFGRPYFFQNTTLSPASYSCLPTTACVYFSPTAFCVCISFHINPLGVPSAYIHSNLFRM